MDEKYDRVCSICEQKFITIYKRQHICSFLCRMQAQKYRSRITMRKSRNGGKNTDPCVVCGWTRTIEIHHEGKNIVFLCPNHHSMVTRGLVNSYKDITIDYIVQVS